MNYPELRVNLRLKKWYQVSTIGLQTSDPMLKNKKTYIFLAAFIAVAIMIWNVLSEPGVKDLPGNFNEVAFIRNEQNSGPVIRIYAVTVNSEKWEEMERYGNYMPHTKYGTTRIYFFSNKKPYPTSLNLEADNIPENYRDNCIGIYEKNGMSQVVLRKHPYRN
ncbi:MAG: hypothetical protein ACYCZO_03315 [Daejeonella sp.]